MPFNLSPNFAIYAWYCLLNTATTILPILQDNHHPKNRPDSNFYHPLMQTELMVIAEMLCMFVWLFSKEERKQGETRPRAPIAVCFIPLAMDLTASSLEMIALNFLSGSVFSITSSIVIVSTAFFTKVILKKTFKNKQILGCLFAVAGVLITGIAEYTEGTSTTPKNLFLVGLVLTIIAYIIEGLEMVVVEIIFTKYDITPNEFVGICGTAGTVFWTLVIVLVSFLGCPMDTDQCVEDYSGGLHLEHAPTYFRDLSGDAFLITMAIVNTLAISRFNYDVNRVIIVADAMVFQVVNIFCNGFVWAVGIIITLLALGNEEFEIESLGYEVILLKLVGFAFATVGLLLYNEVIFKQKEMNEEEPLMLAGSEEQDSGGQIETSGKNM